MHVLWVYAVCGVQSSVYVLLKNSIFLSAASWCYYLYQIVKNIKADIQSFTDFLQVSRNSYLLAVSQKLLSVSQNQDQWEKVFEMHWKYALRSSYQERQNLKILSPLLQQWWGMVWTVWTNLTDQHDISINNYSVLLVSGRLVS